MEDLQEELTEEEEADEQFAEAPGFKPSLEERLRMNFENPRRSGGGDVKTLVPDPKTVAIKMTSGGPSRTFVFKSLSI